MFNFFNLFILFSAVDSACVNPADRPHGSSLDGRGAYGNPDPWAVFPLPDADYYDLENWEGIPDYPGPGRPFKSADKY